MGTSAKTTVYDQQGTPLVAILHKFDGYLEGVGSSLQSFLKNMVIVNGFGSNTPSKAANGMGCLAAQLVMYIKSQVKSYTTPFSGAINSSHLGQVYIVPPESQECEYNYAVKFVHHGDSEDLFAQHRVSLTCKQSDSDRVFVFKLYDDDTVDEEVQSAQ